VKLNRLRLYIRSNQWAPRLVLTLAVSLWFQISVEPKLIYTGDEPHYLLGALSFVQDGDFNVLNNYRQKDYVKIGYQQLFPQLHLLHGSRPGFLPTEHGMMFPLYISLALAIKGVVGVRFFLLATGLLTSCLVMLLCDMLEAPPAVGTIAGSMLVLCPTWQIYITRVYPECTAGGLTVLAAVVLVRAQQATRKWERLWLPFFAGLLTALLPILYLRFICLATGLFGAALTTGTIRRNYRYYLGIACSIGFLLVCVLIFSREAALGPDFTSRNNFSFNGMFERLWYSWFDTWHGLAVYQPVTLLYWWAMVRFCRTRRLIQGDVLAWLAISAACYLLTLGLWQLGPGASLPGRYLCSLLPIFAVLIGNWVMQDEVGLQVRLAAFASLCVVGVAYLMASASQGLPPMQVFTWYRAIFPAPWERHGYLQDMWPTPKLDVTLTIRELETLVLATLFTSKYVDWIVREKRIVPSWPVRSK